METERIFCIVGLGNPGRRYTDTRHNVGFRVIELLRTRLGEASRRKDEHGEYWRVKREDMVLLLCKPATYMNASGIAVARMLERDPCPLERVLCVCDDTALPLGTLRLRPGGTSGGHNGLRSIIEELGTTGFPRLRCGIGAPPAGDEYAAYVLSPFRMEELPVAASMEQRASDAVLAILERGLERAMNEFNTNPAGGPAVTDNGPGLN